MLEDSSDTEVSYFNLPVLGHEYVLSFQVAMEDFPVMYMLYRKRHLNKPVENLVFAITNCTEISSGVSTYLFRSSFGWQSLCRGRLHQRSPLLCKDTSYP